jgi:hypothetical protein
MESLDLKTEQIATYIIRVLELYYQQGVTTTWRDIFTFLRIPEAAWIDEPDIDEKIIVNSEAELAIMKAMISSRFATKH